MYVINTASLVKSLMSSQQTHSRSVRQLSQQASSMMRSFLYLLRLRKKSLSSQRTRDLVPEQQQSLFLSFVAAQVKRADLLQPVTHQESMMVLQQ